MVDSETSTLVDEAASMCNSTKSISNLTLSTNYTVLISNSYSEKILNCSNNSFSTPAYPCEGTNNIGSRSELAIMLCM